MERAGDRTDLYVDMHCHILPGVDDGSKDLAMSLAMARAAVENGIGTIVVTPHYVGSRRNVSADGIRRRVEELQRSFDDEGIPLTLYPGNELLYDSSLPGKLADGEVLTLADSRCCLVEFHPMEDYHYIFDGLRELLYSGYQPILAHCERYVCLVKNPRHVEELAEQKILLQCNAAGVEQKLFQPIPKFINGLLRQELVTFIATDAHRPEGERAPTLHRPAAWLTKKYGASAAQRLLRDNANRYLFGKQ